MQGDEFFNWPVWFALALFGANNWYLKYAFPSWLTGKLSDFLFCFFFPLYCSAILGAVTSWPVRWRVGCGAGVTLVALGSMKISPAISNWVSGVLSDITRPVVGAASLNRVDPTDLIAVPMIVVSVLFALTRKHPHA